MGTQSTQTEDTEPSVYTQINDPCVFQAQRSSPFLSILI